MGNPVFVRITILLFSNKSVSMLICDAQAANRVRDSNSPKIKILI